MRRGLRSAGVLLVSIQEGPAISSTSQHRKKRRPFLHLGTEDAGATKLNYTLSCCSGLQFPHGELFSGGHDRRIVAETGKPMHECLLAKPGELALGIAAC